MSQCWARTAAPAVRPRVVAVDGANNLYIADTYDANIIKIPYVGGTYAAIGNSSSSTPVCTGNDTTECLLPSLASGPLRLRGSDLRRFRRSLLHLDKRRVIRQNALFECSAACLKVLRSGRNHDFPGASQLHRSAHHRWALLPIRMEMCFFTDSVVNSNEQSSVSNVNELKSSGSGFSTTATVLYTLTIASPSQYDNQITSVAVDAAGTVVLCGRVRRHLWFREQSRHSQHGEPGHLLDNRREDHDDPM